MTGRSKVERGHRDRDRAQRRWDNARQQEYYANDQLDCWVYKDGTSVPYEQNVTQPPDIRVPRSAVDDSYCNGNEGNDLSSQFSKLDVSQEQYTEDNGVYPQSYNDPLTDENHESHYTSRNQRPESFYEKHSSSAAPGLALQPQSGPSWGFQQITYEAQNTATEQKSSTYVPFQGYGAQQYPATFDARPQYPSNEQNHIPVHTAQHDGSDTDPSLYKKGITALARISLNRIQKQNNVEVELKACARLGTVFKIPWPEPFCMESDHDDVETGLNAPFRWFVVILEPSQRTKFYSCVPITNYQGSGYRKSGIILSAHSPTGQRAYLPPGSGMGKFIGVKPKVSGSRMPHDSLVNFERIYSIDRDVRAVEFGTVDQNQRQSLLIMLEKSWSAAKTNLSEEERNRRQVDDRNRWERNQDDFADG